MERAVVTTSDDFPGGAVRCFCCYPKGQDVYHFVMSIFIPDQVYVMRLTLPPSAAPPSGRVVVSLTPSQTVRITGWRLVLV